jgi:hypothetical protein
MKNRTVCVLASLALAAFLVTAADPATGTSMLHRNVVDLIELSELIVVGEVVSVVEGFERGVPYTEITLTVTESIKGKAGGVYSFRQFGLQSPRVLEDGKSYLGVAPDGWPRFARGETVMLFLYRPASKTGLRTTVGLFQGTFKQTARGLLNGISNQGLFKDTAIDPGLLDPDERSMLRATHGPVSTRAFTSFVRRAVQDRWIERGTLQHVH